jgi:metallo-beta-lactamase family protein
MHIRFLGAAGEVTGSRYLLEGSVSGKSRKMLVECGMFQGGRESIEKNLQPFGFAPEELDVVLLTHAHIDHSGLLPRLCAKGYQKKIYCTPGTLELLKVLLMDSAHLQSESLRRAEKKVAAGTWRGDLPQPLYTTEEAEQCLSQIQTVPYEKSFSPVPGVQCTFHDAGHILGAAFLVMDVAIEADTQQAPGKESDGQSKKKPTPKTTLPTKRIVFSGDIGVRNRPLMHDPQRIDRADILVMESTYGDRLHRSLKDTEDELVDVVTSTLKRGGNVVMPAFAVGRTQEVIFLLIDLVRRKRLPFLTIFVDSPMATKASEITERFLHALDDQSQHLHQWFHANPDAVRLRFVKDVNESKTVNQIKSGAVIISASGMCEAGRIVHHLFWNLPRPQSSVVITGFQAGGTKGRQLVDGVKTIRLLGQDVPVKASIHTLGGLSAHGDQADLLWWLKGLTSPPAKVFIVHGEQKASENFAAVVRDELGWPHVTLPQRGSLHPCF